MRYEHGPGSVANWLAPGFVLSSPERYQPRPLVGRGACRTTDCLYFVSRNPHRCPMAAGVAGVRGTDVACHRTTHILSAGAPRHEDGPLDCAAESMKRSRCVRVLSAIRKSTLA